jgi:hypothetical protein
MTDFLEKGTRFVYRGRRTPPAPTPTVQEIREPGSYKFPWPPKGYVRALSRRGSGIVHLFAEDGLPSYFMRKAVCGATRVFLASKAPAVGRPCRACYRIASEQ